ncbi:MAG: 1-aminocyclopropane-1-carboxylate deaminase/D-cysteine desulfhydrase [Chitinophagales bacterium]|jgi:1-aminocyclopropane-1-carboxylate deaminase|nr:1-aminocyclopropane-1-carboxylate deaminase/D-cysteine desulfhydrase [Chitinophagales bacterium]HQV78956.1 pyridoxal-phosphate dependent enzyme [Chitinophagales bacterium]HQW68169.1 pyridoxal-phosphate dependent enzyme [Flavobacterium sp.]HQW68212.1 pyridoxal-phosphate dependent enzyme [Flavobacterium sp.]HRB67941.1 pyridoxal-phosphate dependent enzyme [Chitinophagales bacterium]
MFHLPSPIQKIENELTRKFQINLFIKRDDLIHKDIPGNKWRKLKYNLEQAKIENKNTILTFGGAYSNHITATAAAGKYLGFDTIGIIRGEAYLPLNKSLQFAKDCGMHLLYLDRENYKHKNFQQVLPNDMAPYYLIPEGGSNELALKGCAEIVVEIEIDFDFIASACGTATTIAGIATALKSHQTALGFAVLKHENLNQEINEKFPFINTNIIFHEAHFGAYAKINPSLIQFIKNFYQEQLILLDYVYTGKMMFRLFELMNENYFPKNSTIVVLHTGGVSNANVFEVK